MAARHWKVGSTDGPSEPVRNAEQEAARIAGARMGGGDLAPSAPVPLERKPTPQEFGNALADTVCIVAAVALLVMLLAHWLAR